MLELHKLNKGKICNGVKRIIVFITVIFSFLIFIKYANAEIVLSTELIEKANFYNNKTVEYQGEVAGDVMIRGNFAWVNLNDGTNAIGVFGKKNLIAGLIKYKGDYNYKGDILLIKGVFHRACPQHGGDLDIHIEKVIKIKDGYPTPHNLSFRKATEALGVFVMALGLSILCWFRRKRDI